MSRKTVHHSIKTELIKMQLLVAVGVLSAAVLGFLFYAFNVVYTEFEHSLVAKAGILAQSAEPALSFKDKREAERLLSILSHEQGIQTAYLLDVSGQVVASFGGGSPKFKQQDLQRVWLNRSWRSLECYHPVLRGEEKLGLLYLNLNTSPIYQEFYRFSWIILIVFLFGIFISWVLANVTQTRFSAPIIQLANTANTISMKGDYSLRASFSEGMEVFDEARTLAAEFNRMLETIHEKTQERATLLAREQTAVEASSLKSQFLANMSHEIRTPISGILGLTELLSETPLSDLQKEYFSAIKVSASHLLAVINDILDLSKVESGKLILEETSFNLLEIINDVEIAFRFSCRAKGIQLLMEHDPALERRFMGDPVRVKQVIVNLISNAVKFTESGSVKVKLRLVSSESGYSEINCEVEDTGIGMTEEIKKKIFTPFTQADASSSRKYGGTGLGLVISRRLVELMGGEMGLSSQHGKGSKFWFRIKLRIDSDLRQTSYSSSVQDEHVSDLSINIESLRDVRVLVAEDNEINRMIILKMLKDFNFQVDSVSNGVEILAALKSKRYELIFMDCQMPEMDGYTASAEIRKSQEPYRSIPIVALTANAMRGDAQKCFNAGMDDYIAKPISKIELKRIVKKWCHRLVKNAS